MTTQRSQPKMTNFIAGCIGCAEFLSLSAFGVYAFGPVIWELMQ